MSKRNKKRKEGETQAVIDWEEESYFPRKIKEEMKSMWEIPQIYQFLHFTKDILNIPQVTIYEMERMLVIPRASKQLANIMTCLLSCPITKAKLHKIPPMPYEFWTNILMHKINNWFKLYSGKHKDVIKVLETIGIEPEFWDIFPEASIITDRDFEDLSFKQRVWLLKTICDTLMHTRKTIQEEIANHAWEDQVEINLGTDRHGAKYIYFPQFISSELRIYRHCMNNNVLSTSKPIIPKTVAKSETKTKVNNPVQGKVKKSRKRKARWQNGLCSKIKKDKPAKPPEKKIDKQFYICNCIDSAMNSQTSENTDLSCTSTNSNSSNNNNNNNINLNNLDRKRTRNSLKTSEISTMSNNTKYSNTNSNSYDNNVSNEGQLIDKNVKESTFKGFSRSSNEKDGIAIINQLLNRLKTEMDIKYINSHVIVENMMDTKDDIENSISIEANENNFESISNECNSSKHCLDNLSNNSKTDDEKLNEIIVIGNTILKNKTLSTNSDDVNDLDSSTSKSDDEKLNETETSIINKMKNISNDVPDTTNKCNIKQRKKSPNNGEMKDTQKKDNIINESFLETDETQNCIRRSLRTKGNLQMEHKSFCNDISQIINTDINTEEVENNLERKNETASFKKMLKELGVSNFRLVADSVETLRNLISSFSLNTPELCEVKLVNKLTELLKSVENIETVLKDTTKKAKAKLLKEWTNFKIGSMEDQDSSSESGVSSNWWILGSQDYKLPTANDATLQTLSKSTLSPISTQSCAHSSECKNDEEQCTSGKEKEYKKSKSEEHDEKSNDREQQENGGNSEGKNQQKHKEDKECNRKEEEQQTRRVLRARGISSYTEQLYPYEEIDESELGEWTDIKAFYAPPSAQTCASTTYSSSKNRHDHNWSEKEDSDQDWILPGSRRRKNKRSSNNKKLRSLQAKNLNKKTNLVQDTRKESTSNHKIFHKPRRLTTSTLGKIKYPQIQQDSVRTISSIEASKIEYVDSVHSELDIKDETPILDNVSNQYKNNYNMNGISYLVQSNPTVIGLTQPNTFVQTNSLIPNIVPSFQPNYYMQEVQPEYVVYDQQPSFVPLQQSIIQQVPCIVTSQEIINHSRYSPYFINAMKSNSNLPNDQLQKCQPENSNIIKIVQPDNNVNKIPQKKASTSKSNSSITKRNTTKRYTLNSTSQKAKSLKRNINDPKEKTTSLIILSDSDDEIEIINEKTTNNQKDKSPQNQESNISEIANNALKNIIPQEIMQRIHQGCISITPIKPAPIQNTPTQLVVVVNETGNYYALALPNGSKLILTPEQVAQIRASNGGKLVL